MTFYDIVFRRQLGALATDLVIDFVTNSAQFCQSPHTDSCEFVLSQTRNYPMKRFFYLLPFLTIVTLCAACSSVNQVTSYITPYRIDVRQGNWVTQEMVSQLKPGQTREQVRFILGSPLVSDMFHADRWDYIYRLQPGRGEAEQRRIVVFFQDDKLVRVGGDVIADDGKKTPTKTTNQVIEVVAPADANQKKSKTE